MPFQSSLCQEYINQRSKLLVSGATWGKGAEPRLASVLRPLPGDQYTDLGVAVLTLAGGKEPASTVVLPLPVPAG